MDRSLVAGVNALFRAVESRRPASERLLDDPWAQRLAERDPRVQLVRFARFLVPPLSRMVDQLQTVHCVRHRAIDELTRRAIGVDGFRQVVIVGAGYDMRAYRLRPQSESVRWFEVDHPGTLARKLRRLQGAMGPEPSVRRIPLDLMRDSLAEALGRTDFDPALRTCFVVEGLVHYLDGPRLEELLAATRHMRADHRLILSYIRSEMYARAPGLFIRLVQWVREVPQLHFEPQALSALLARHGLLGFRSWDVEEQIEQFAPAARGRSIGVSQDVAQVEGRP